jgi:phenylalanine-4-hydroxylase
MSKQCARRNSAAVRAKERAARLTWTLSIKSYGAGIVSSYGESVYALDNPAPRRIGFDLERVMRTDYRIHAYRQVYFVIESFEDLKAKTADADFGPVYHRLEKLSDLAPDAVLPTDILITP